MIAPEKLAITVIRSDVGPGWMWKFTRGNTTAFYRTQFPSIEVAGNNALDWVNERYEHGQDEFLPLRTQLKLQMKKAGFELGLAMKW